MFVIWEKIGTKLSYRIGWEGLRGSFEVGVMVSVLFLVLYCRHNAQRYDDIFLICLPVCTVVMVVSEYCSAIFGCVSDPHC